VSAIGIVYESCRKNKLLESGSVAHLMKETQSGDNKTQTDSFWLK
jgi:hypothetical protein